MNVRAITILSLVIFTFFSSCKKDEINNNNALTPTCDVQEISSASVVEGFNILEQLSGIWSGPLKMPSPYDNQTNWIADYRPISPSQICASSEFTTKNELFTSFFIAKHHCEYKVVLKYDAKFKGLGINSYMIIDSISENTSENFYRFIDPVAKEDRMEANIIFRNDSLIMRTYTSPSENSLEQNTITLWSASLKNDSEAQEAIDHFNFPQKEMTKDFSTVFNGLSEATFPYSNSDPYPIEDHPYLSDVRITVVYGGFTLIDIDPKVQTVLILGTEPMLISGDYTPISQDYRTRFVFSGSEQTMDIKLKNIHPGRYNYNVFYDRNRDQQISIGDHINPGYGYFEMILEPEESYYNVAHVTEQIL